MQKLALSTVKEKIANLGKLKPYRRKRFFNMVPFLAIAFVGFTPLPHFPFRGELGFVPQPNLHLANYYQLGFL